MIEVFKTNVDTPESAAALIEQLQKAFAGYEINFDLDDCDNILRVDSQTDTVDSAGLVKHLDSLGYLAEVLSDEAFVGQVIEHLS